MKKKMILVWALVMISLFTLPFIVNADKRIILKPKYEQSLNSFSVGFGLVIEGQNYSPVVEFKFSQPRVDILAAFRLKKEEKKWWERDKNVYRPNTLVYTGIEKELIRREELRLKAGLLYLGGKGFRPNLSLEVSNYQYFVELKGIGFQAPILVGVVGIRF